MSTYPLLPAGKRITGSLLRSMIKQTFTKNASHPRASNATSSDDPELVGIALGVGVWLIETMLFWNGTTGDFKNQWGFTGTWSGNRAVLGSSNATEAQDWANTLMTNGAVALGGSRAYGHNSASAYSTIYESATATVTVAGTMSIQWAQETSDAAATNLLAGSRVMIRQTG